MSHSQEAERRSVPPNVVADQATGHHPWTKFVLKITRFTLARVTVSERRRLQGSNAYDRIV
jgi:hypothetical protein